MQMNTPIIRSLTIGFCLMCLGFPDDTITVWVDDAKTRKVTVSKLDPDQIADEFSFSLGLGIGIGDLGISVGRARENEKETGIHQPPG